MKKELALVVTKFCQHLVYNLTFGKWNQWAVGRMEGFTLGRFDSWDWERTNMVAELCSRLCSPSIPWLSWIEVCHDSKCRHQTFPYLPRYEPYMQILLDNDEGSGVLD
jgi:hypothetical protein